MKKSQNFYLKNFSFLSENFHFLVVKFSVYLNRRVFVMLSPRWEHLSESTLSHVDAHLINSVYVFESHEAISFRHALLLSDWKYTFKYQDVMKIFVAFRILFMFASVNKSVLCML